MTLGILVNTDRHKDELVGLTDAALSKGHKTIIFFMDGGVRLLNDPDVTGLCMKSGVSMSYCDYTTKKNGLTLEDIPDKIVCGSQFDNASMNHDADRVIVL